MKQDLKKQVLIFLALTFGLTYLLNWWGYRQFGVINPQTILGWQTYLSIQMFIPATVAFTVLKLSKQKLTTPLKMFWVLFLGIVGISILSLFYDPTLFTVPQDESSVPITLSIIVIQAISVVGSLSLIIMWLKSNLRKQLHQAKLSLGVNKRYYLITLLLLSFWIFINAYFNSIFNLGAPSVVFNPPLFLITFIGALIISPLTNWAFFFGEEYGWRVFLQDRLTTLLGTLPGVLAVGIIWGLWHAPVIALGYNYPGEPLFGMVLMTVFTVLIGMIYSIAVLKTKSVWSAVWLHLATNNGITLAMTYISNPENSVHSFGMGVYGLILLAVFALGLAIATNIVNNKKT